MSNAGATVLGTRMWIVGGETSGGTPTAVVQMLEPEPRLWALLVARVTAHRSSATNSSSWIEGTTGCSC